jgi:uncharacterized Zn finger protein (UPF0148 family)
MLEIRKTGVFFCPGCDQVISCQQDHSGKEDHGPVEAHNHLMPGVFEA